jgi:hypothetical protein
MVLVSGGKKSSSGRPIDLMVDVSRLIADEPFSDRKFEKWSHSVLKSNESQVFPTAESTLLRVG